MPDLNTQATDRRITSTFQALTSADLNSAVDFSDSRSSFQITLHADSQDQELMRLEWLIQLMEEQFNDPEARRRALAYINSRFGA